jgi:adenylate cyclase
MVESLREEQKILAVSQELAGELKLDLLIARIMRATTELLGADRSTLLIHDPKTDQLYSLYAEGNQIREIRIPANRGIAGAVFNSGTLENIADAYADPRFDMSVDRETGFATRSILCAPIANKAGGRIGVTQVLNKKLGAFTVKDEARLRAFSAQIAVCLENAKLFDDVLSMKNYNESILKSTSNAIVTFDEDAVIVTTNPAAQQLLGGNRDSLIGQPGATVFAGQNGWIIDALDRALETGRMSIAVDTEIAHAQTSASSVNVTTAPLIDAGDNRIGSMLVIEDITREKRVRSTMARYMSKEVADQLIEAGEDVLGGKDQQVSILFADVRGFTTLAENTSARETVSMLNEYFTDMVDVIFAHGGILDKYIGDAMMALFGAPFTGPHDADNAVAAANQMMTALAALNQRRADRGGKPIEIGLGISTGEVVVGNIGSSKRMEYTVIGDSVNLASRLEGTNKFYGTRILFSQFTMAQLKQPRHVREVDLVRVKGKDQPVKVFEALGYRASAEGAALEAMLEHYRDAISAYRAHQWQAADAGFAAALHCRPGDGPSLIYRDRCRRFIATPPPVEWDGVWEMQSK